MADRVSIDEVGKTGSEDALIDARIAEMRRLLEQLAGTSTTEALRTLREAFPDAPLDERVRAIKYSKH